MFSLGIDVGSSSVKVALLDIESGKCIASSTNPKTEAPIKSLQKGWAEQAPESWWDYMAAGIKEISAAHDLKQTVSIGISYQMHGLVALDKDFKPVRDAIIWCDSRAVQTGRQALEDIGYDKCMEHLLNSPGNFTASKLAWVRQNEPDTYAKISKFMLPGDYIAYKLTGTPTTTATGLSEGILWDFKEGCRADFVTENFGIDSSLFCDIAPAIGIGGRTTGEIQSLFGIPAGTPVSYRAGDQPNNAFSLNVLNPGEIAATGGTSGVVYGVTDLPKADPKSRVNTFLHVSPSTEQRLGVLLCINGTGILNAWCRRNITPDLSYAQMNELSARAPVGSDGLTVLPFGNGAERVLENRNIGARFCGLDLVRHTKAHILRAEQEGIAFSFKYGIDIMKDLGLKPDVIRAGMANTFLNPIFRTTLATLTGARIELFDTDGALGAARGAALGAGIYKDAPEAFATLTRLDTIYPEPSWQAPLDEAYTRWKTELENTIR